MKISVKPLDKYTVSSTNEIMTVIGIVYDVTNEYQAVLYTTDRSVIKISCQRVRSLKEFEQLIQDGKYIPIVKDDGWNIYG